MIILITQI